MNYSLQFVLTIFFKDSILSKTDADIVEKWLNDDAYNVLQYR